ncbi:hypothetical protein APUTEX25_001601 [Auxenochlorella protothecoides]|nr:hypothetical protein APUTEX25_001601 [Auxenochlorella protothecoides]|eukprot:RMZ52211.1 hypothetical protein APUTEX25_001601 [Auxenochlorella protothecoides]
MTETVNIACIPLWRCDNCSATADQTPLQRRGPRGVGTLCNACGLWYAKTGSMRSTRGPRQSKKAESFRASLPSSQTASATLLHSSSSAFHCPTPGSLKRFRSADSDDPSHRSSTHRGQALPRGHARGLARLALAPAPCYAPPRSDLAHPQRVVHSTAQAVLDLLAEALLDRGRAEA